ncbi:MAG TPA: hypothetical protein VHV54_06590, partial [Candidatus Binatia bacterium]|nr:hypothetical protein [Candidatus Binatia bacterium]
MRSALRSEHSNPGAAAEESPANRVFIDGQCCWCLRAFRGIRLALRERGYIEGQTIAIEYRYAEGKLDRLPELAMELVRLKVAIIVVTGGDPDIRAAKNAT